MAYALVARHPGGFLWGHVRLEGEVFDDDDPLKRSLVPADRFLLVAPRDLAPDDASGEIALKGLARTGDEEEPVRRFADFLRLPAQTQDLFSRLPREGPSPVLVLTGAQRLTALYTREAVGPTVRSILQFGGSVLMTWADAPPLGRREFEHVLHLRGHDPTRWREALVTVEKGWPHGLLRTGAEVRLGELPLVASILEQKR